VLAGRLPYVSDLPSLLFIESVIKETMRLYPPAWSVARTAINDFELDGYRIPAGANIVMSQWIYIGMPGSFPNLRSLILIVGVPGNVRICPGLPTFLLVAVPGSSSGHRSPNRSRPDTRHHSSQISARIG